LIKIVAKDAALNTTCKKVFLINPGYYKEYHYKLLSITENLGLTYKKTTPIFL